MKKETGGCFKIKSLKEIKDLRVSSVYPNTFPANFLEMSDATKLTCFVMQVFLDKTCQIIE